MMGAPFMTRLLRHEWGSTNLPVKVPQSQGPRERLQVRGVESLS